MITPKQKTDSDVSTDQPGSGLPVISVSQKISGIHQMGVSPIPDIQEQIYSKNVINFLERLDTDVRNRLLSKRFYHSSPAAYRDEISDTGLKNPAEIFTAAEKDFIIRITEKIISSNGDCGTKDFLNKMILGIHGEKSRGLYISSSPAANYYPVPERIRLYFRYISENLIHLDQTETDFAIDAFRKYHKKLSTGTDTWEIMIIAPILLESFCSGYAEMDKDDVDFIAEAIIGNSEVNIPVAGDIPSQYISLHTSGEIFDDVIRWNGCKDLLKRI